MGTIKSAATPDQPRLRLYHYWRSSSSWRVRWALAHKGWSAEMVPVNLLDDETDRPEHRARNPLGYIPVLVFLDRPAGDPLRYLSESVAILEWLEEAGGGPSLLPREPLERAHVRQLCEVINAGTQPLQNLNVMDLLTALYSPKDPDARKTWARHWIRQGLTAFEKLTTPHAGQYSFGHELTAADLFLVPQCYNALRFDIALDSEFPLLARIYEAALTTPSGIVSHPDRYAPLQ